MEGPSHMAKKIETTHAHEICPLIFQPTFRSIMMTLVPSLLISILHVKNGLGVLNVALGTMDIYFTQPSSNYISRLVIRITGLLGTYIPSIMLVENHSGKHVLR